MARILDELFMPPEELFFPRSDSQTKEKKVSLKACKSEAMIFVILGPFTFTLQIIPFQRKL